MVKKFLLKIFIVLGFVLVVTSNHVRAQTGTQIGVHVGLISPVSEFDDVVSQGVGLGLDAMYITHSKSSLEVGIGLSLQTHFYDEKSNFVDFSILPITTNVNFYLGDAFTRGVFSFGFGLYKVEADVDFLGQGFSFDESDAGINFGAGANIFITDYLSADLMAKFHRVFTDGDNIEFFTLGVTILFTNRFR